MSRTSSLPRRQCRYSCERKMTRVRSRPHCTTPWPSSTKMSHFYRPRLLSDYVFSSIAQPRFNAVLVSLFSAVALLVAAAGIFGVMSYTVAQRTHEIGIRLALGAQRSDVLRLIFGEGMRLVALGVMLGIASVFAIRRLLGSLLYGIGATDPVAILSVTMLLPAVAFVACWSPSRRASGVDPVIALRAE